MKYILSIWLLIIQLALVAQTTAKPEIFPKGTHLVCKDSSIDFKILYYPLDATFEWFKDTKSVKTGPFYTFTNDSNLSSEGSEIVCKVKFIDQSGTIVTVTSDPVRVKGVHSITLTPEITGKLEVNSVIRIKPNLSPSDLQLDWTWILGSDTSKLETAEFFLTNAGKDSIHVITKEGNSCISKDAYINITVDPVLNPTILPIPISDTFPQIICINKDSASKYLVKGTMGASVTGIKVYNESQQEEVISNFQLNKDTLFITFKSLTLKGQCKVKIEFQNAIGSSASCDFAALLLDDPIPPNGRIMTTPSQPGLYFILPDQKSSKEIIYSWFQVDENYPSKVSPLKTGTSSEYKYVNDAGYKGFYHEVQMTFKDSSCKCSRFVKINK